MTTHVFDYAAFTAQFPAFADSTTYPSTTLSGYWTMARQYISPVDGTYMAGDVLQLALNLMTAHLAQCFTLINKGEMQVVVSSATQGSVNVSLEPPPASSGWGWWLSTTPYGQQLRALLGTQGVSGFFVGGSMERAAFRKGGGIW